MMTKQEIHDLMTAEYRPLWQRVIENIGTRIVIRVLIAAAMVYLLRVDPEPHMWGFCVFFGYFWFEPLKEWKCLGKQRHGD